MMRKLSPSILGVSLAVLSFAGAASAHISLEKGGTHNSRYGDSNLKGGPCGEAGGVRGTNVYTYAPGETITVSVIETIPHPSYFRWAFDADGDSLFVEPASIKPIDPSRPCPIDSGDHCGAADYYNNASVLPGMDDLNPHMAGAAGAKYTWQLTLPNVECTNCTLQIIQVMEDNLYHGDYDPTPGVGVEDIYHQCIDIVLTKAATTTDAGAVAGDSGVVTHVDAGAGADSGTVHGQPDSGATPGNDAGSVAGHDAGGTGGPVTNDAGGTSGGTDAGSSGSSGGSGASGGCSVTGSRVLVSSFAGWAVLGLAALGLRRRRTNRA